jgi:UDP-glucose 4-epimerase
VTTGAAGAFNIAGDGVLDRKALGDVFGAPGPSGATRCGPRCPRAAWRVRAAPVPGDLFTGLMGLPLMSTERARAEFGWASERTGAEALTALLEGVAARSGSDLPPLRP